MNTFSRSNISNNHIPCMNVTVNDPQLKTYHIRVEKCGDLIIEAKHQCGERNQPQQLSLPQNGVVHRAERLEADVKVLYSHVGQLFCMGLLDPSNHRLLTQNKKQTVTITEY